MYEAKNFHAENNRFLYYYKDLFTHKDINTYTNGVVLICLNTFLKIQVSRRKEKNMQNYAQIDNIDYYSLLLSFCNV